MYRFIKKHMLLAGLWYSVDDPYMNTFLRPIIDEINHLYHNDKLYLVSNVCSGG